MAIPTAFEAKQSGTKSLNNFNPTQAVNLQLNPGTQDGTARYVIWGRVVIRNLDGSAQNAGAQLQDNAGHVLDRVDLRIAADDSTPDPTQAGGQSLSLLATLELELGTAWDQVSIHCATYNGTAEEARLIAISVDGFGPGAPDQINS
jgi:hypothetical protein